MDDLSSPSVATSSASDMVPSKAMATSHFAHFSPWVNPVGLLMVLGSGESCDAEVGTCERSRQFVERKSCFCSRPYPQALSLRCDSTCNFLLRARWPIL